MPQEQNSPLGAFPAKLDEQTEERPRVLLHMPVDVRSVSLAIVAVLASVYALHWAKVVVVPVLLGVMFSYALNPAVDLLQRWRIPRALGSTAVLGAILGAITWSGFALAEDAEAVIDTLPRVAQRVRETMEGQRRAQPTPTTIERVQQAALELERAAAAQAAASPSSAGASGARASATTPPASPAAQRGVTRVVVERPAFDVREYLWTGTLGLAAFLGQTALVFFVALFLLSAGDTFRRKMVKLAGPTLGQKKITIQALDEVSSQIQRYLFVQIATSVVVGVATGLAFAALGLNHAAVWGVFAGVTNLIPYIGAVIVGASSAIVGFMQFDSVDQALVIGGASFAIHAFVGNILTPWWTGRASRMSPFVVFVGIVFFGWLWGAVGLILGTPILMVVKAITDRVDKLKPIGEFLGA